MFTIRDHKEVPKNGTADVNNSDSHVTLVSIMTKMMHQVLLIFPKGRLCMFESNIEHTRASSVLFEVYLIVTLIQKNSEFAYWH